MLIRCARQFALAIFLVVVFHGSLGANPARSAPSEEEIAAASQLLETGRLDEAQVLIDRLRERDPNDLNVLFLSGGLNLMRARYAEAIEDFRKMLTRDPTLIRPRLELARALFTVGDYQTARYHFEQALAAPLPDMVKSNVLGYLSLIREHLPSFAVSVELLADSNPKQATSNSVVEIDGLLYQLNESARSQRAWGVRFTGQAKVPLPADTSWFARGYVERNDYTGGDLDFTYAQVLGGKHINFGKHGVDFEAGGQLATYAGHKLYQGATGRVTDFVQVTPRLGMNLAADAKQLDYEDYPFLSGWQYAAGGDMRYALTPASAISVGVSYVVGTAEEDAYAFEGPGIDLRYVREWQGGWITSLSYNYTHLDFDGVDPFFGVVRADRQHRVEFGLANRRLAYKSFAPRLIIGNDNRDSNIDLYSFRRTYLRVGVVTEF